MTDPQPPAATKTTWRSAVAALFGFATLAGVFALIWYDVDHKLLPAFVAFGAALASGFYGDEIAVTGKINWDWALKYPLEFAAAGGAATFILVYVLLVTTVSDPAPGKVFSMQIIEGQSFRSVVEDAARNADAAAVIYPSCASITNRAMRSTSPSAENVTEWVENLSPQFADAHPDLAIHARLLEDQKVLEVNCENAS